METRKLLEELENAVLNASDVPFTNKKMVDKEEVARIIDAINQSLPNELESAKRIVADKERILLDAEKKSADELRTSSVTYATDVLKYVETNMENVLDSLKKNRQSLIDSNAQPASYDDSHDEH